MVFLVETEGAEQRVPHTKKGPQIWIKTSDHKSKERKNKKVNAFLLCRRRTIGFAVVAQPVSMRQFIHQFSFGSRKQWEWPKEPQRWKEGWRERNRLESHAEWGELQSSLPFYCFVFLTAGLSFKVILNLPSHLFCPCSRSSVLILSIFAQLKNAAPDSPSSSVRSAPTSCFMEWLGIIAVQMILFVFGTKLTDLYFYHSSCRNWKERFGQKQKKNPLLWRAYDYSLREHTADLSLRQLSQFDLSQSLFATVAHFTVRGYSISEQITPNYIMKYDKTMLLITHVSSQTCTCFQDGLKVSP